MTLHRTLVFTIVLCALTGLLASTAAAQWVTKNAQFTLPFEAIWEGRIVPPGDYTLSVFRLSGSRDVVYRVDIAGADMKHTILGFNPPGPEVGTTAMLVAEYCGSTFNIRALHLPKANLVLTFFDFKKERTKTKVAGARELMPTVPIQIALK